MDIGIDLGTTYSVIAVKGKVSLSASYPEGVYLEECDVTIIPTPVGDPTFPSVFWVNPDDPDEVLIGSDAKEKAKEGEAPIMFSKRSIGTQEPLRLGNRSYTAKEVATEILRHLKQCAEQALGEPVRRAVVTHPAYFDPGQVQETREAAIAAGFDMALPEQVMMEPAAAALAYTLGDDRDPLRVMTYDLGGGTFDVTVLERREGVITIKAFNDDHLLGGYNFDRALVQWMLERLRESGRKIPYDENDPADRARCARLLQLAEKVKFDLAAARNDKVKVNIKGNDILVDAAGRPVQIILGITGQEYTALIQEELGKTIRCCHQVLAKAGMNADDLDLILLVGGSTYGQWVLEAIEQTFDSKIELYNPDLMVAAGAAIRAAELLPVAADAAIELVLDVHPHLALPSRILLSSQVLGDGDLIKQAIANPQTLPTISSAKEPRPRLSDSQKEISLTAINKGIPDKLPYRIISPLGQSAFSIVYLAYDETSYSQRKVALKMPKDEFVKREWIRFVEEKEAKVWKFLSEHHHHNILNFEDLKSVPPYTFFVMEYINGGNLIMAIEKLSSGEKFSRVIYLLKQICEGLSFAHTQQVVHGGIKPQNILISTDLKQIKLGDFGLSFNVQKNKNGTIDIDHLQKARTLMFLAPESLDGNITLQTDIYALGVILFYLLIGEYPFEDIQEITSSGQVEQLKAKRIKFRPELRTIDPRIPRWLEEVVQYCMAPRPEDRFADASELLEYISPLKEKQIILTAWPGLDQILDYDLQVKGKRFTQSLFSEVSYQTIKALSERWDQLGCLALERKVNQGLDVVGIEKKIANLLDYIVKHSDFILGRKLCEILKKQSSKNHPIASLMLLYDPSLAQIPWELLGIGGKHLCRCFPMSRQPRMSRPNDLHSKLDNSREKIKVLLIADPCGDLPGARAECKRLQMEFATYPFNKRLEVKVADESTDSWDIRVMMRECDILHYAGHSVFSEKHGDLSKSGWLLKEGNNDKPEDLLRASALDEFWSIQTPLLVFANSCVSAKASLAVLQKRAYSDAALGLAQAFLASGVVNYIGTMWAPPDDETTAEFASVFYHEFFTGRTVSQSLLAARESCARKFGEADLTWARYALFGDPSTYIPVKETG